MPVVIEMLNKGLVTARDPILLRPGELQRCNDCFYRPNDQAIWKAPGRTKYNASAINSTSTSVKGLRGLQFDDFGSSTSDDFLIGYETSSYWYSTIPTTGDPPTGSFSSLATGVGTGDSLDAVQYNNRYYLLNGNLDSVRNLVVKPAVAPAGAPQTRLHGMLPVVNVPNVALTASLGWPSVDQGFGTTSPNNYYFFFYTEVANPDSADELESSVRWPVTAFDSTTSPAHGVIQVTGTNGVTVTLPGSPYVPVNPNATHVRVYLHGPESSDDWNNSFLITSYRVGQVAILASGATTISLGVNQLAAGFNITTSASGWTNSSNATTDDSTSASTSTVVPLLCKNFGFAGLTGSIWGIEVEVKANDNVSVWGLDVKLSWDNGVANFTTVTNTTDLILSSPVGLYVVGSPTDTWGRTWALAELNNGSFAVQLTPRLLASTVNNRSVFVNFVKVKVNYGLTPPLSKAGPIFPYVSTQVGPIITVEGANGPPPVSSTGDIFEGQLVVNDMSDPSMIRYSMPDAVDYFPFSYFINFETKEADVVTYIRSLGDKLIVGAAHQIYRVNYLPRAEDAEFDRGRCYEIVAADHGIIGTQAACLFSPPEKNDSSDGQLLAYVSTNGIHMTNGFSSSTLTEDLDWANMVNLTQLSKSILVNYPKYYELVMYYIPFGDTTSLYPTRALHFSYHPSHIKEGGKLLVSGPCVVTAASGYSGKYLNKPIHYTGRTDGTVYVEDQAFTDAAGVGINPDIVTRDIYAAGIGYESTHERLWVRHYQHNPPSTVLVTNYWRNTEGEFTHPSAAGTPWTQLSFSTTAGAPLTGSAAGLVNSGALSRMHIAAGVQESMVYRFQQADGGTGMALSLIGIEGEGHGLEEH